MAETPEAGTTAVGGLGLGRAPDPYAWAVDVDPDELPFEKRGIAWAIQLCQEIDRRAPQIRQLRSYFDGDQPLKFATEMWTETFGDRFGPMVDNWCRIVIEAVTERMRIQGFQFGDDDADEDANRIWQRNRMDLDCDVVHTDALVTGYSYVLVWPGETVKRKRKRRWLWRKTEETKLPPMITVQDPLHSVVATDPATGEPLAGLTRWRDRTGIWYSLVITPDRWWKIRCPGAPAAPTPERGQTAEPDWEIVESAAHNADEVLLVEFTNTPDVYGRGISDLLPILPLQDATNKLLSDEMVASEFASFPQRVLLGVEVPTYPPGHPKAGEPMQDLRGGINRWLTFEAEEGSDVKPQLQELSVNDLNSYQGAIAQMVQHISALTRTPPHYLLGQVVNVSADALRAAESGLVSRTRRRMRLFGESWETVMRLAFLMDGDTERASMWDANVIWADPETVSEAARVDALAKMRTLGVPERILWERWGMSPDEIDRALRYRAEEASTAALRLGVTPNGADVEPEPAPGQPPQLPAPEPEPEPEPEP